MYKSQLKFNIFSFFFFNEGLRYDTHQNVTHYCTYRVNNYYVAYIDHFSYAFDLRVNITFFLFFFLFGLIYIKKKKITSQ